MVNELVKSSVRDYIDTAIRDARSAAAVNHSGMRGTIREIAIKNLFAPLLTSQNDTGSGKIVDHTGFQSQETDVIIYSRGIHPPILYSDRTDLGLFPAETCIYAIEIKSKVTAAEIQDAMGKARTLRELKYASGLFDSSGRSFQHPLTPVIPAFFCFRLRPNRRR